MALRRHLLFRPDAAISQLLICAGARQLALFSRRRAARGHLVAASRAMLGHEGQLLVYRRALGADAVLVAINAGAAPVAVELAGQAPEALVPLVVAGHATNSGPSLALGPLSGAVLRASARDALNHAPECRLAPRGWIWLSCRECRAPSRLPLSGSATGGRTCSGASPGSRPRA